MMISTMMTATMKYLAKFPLPAMCLLLLSSACEKDGGPAPLPRILFSVDLDLQKFDPSYREAYLAAYTPEGKLLNYGSLSDSSQWDLESATREDSIDILYIEIWHDQMLSVHHIKNVAAGQFFEDDSRVVLRPSPGYLDITLKVEDFGNHTGNTTSAEVFEMIPRNFNRGYPYTGEFDWNNIEDGYAYKSSFVDSDPRYQGAALLIFERGTNLPFLYYADLAATDIKQGDTLTIRKSDFSPAQVRTLTVNSGSSAFNNIFLYTYNTAEGRKDLITSFYQHTGDQPGKSMYYAASEVLPINCWNLRYFASEPGHTSYTARASSPVPSSLDIEELSGQEATLSGDHFDFTHSATLTGRTLARSWIQFTNGSGSNVSYLFYFDGTESTGKVSLHPFEIPAGILAKHTGIPEINSSAWKPGKYSQAYTGIPGNSALEFLRNTLLNWFENNSMTGNYTYEEFTVGL